MKYILFSLSIILLIGCNNQKEKTLQPTLRKNQLEVTVIEKASRISKKSNATVNEYFLQINEKKYFIKFSEGYVSKEKIKPFLNQTIVIKGEIKTGKWENDTAGSFSQGTQTKKARAGSYVVIYKIYK